MPINKNELTKEMIAKAMQCETAEDLVALAKSELKNMAGGYCLTDCIDPDCIEKGMFHP